MRFRRPRRLTDEERRLWAHVARGVTPMRGRPRPEEPPPAEPAAAPRPAPPSPVPSPPARAAPPGPPPLPPITALERRERLALRRGRQDVDGAIDLHGLRQADAHDRLRGFLFRAQASGHALVLVVTGKGGTGAAEGPFEERGVLRRMVPHWLRMPELRPVVLGFEEAGPRHGGSGALYVRLRRRRAPGA